MDIVSESRSHGGRQLVATHFSRATQTDMSFSVFLPPQVDSAVQLPVVWFLSGLTCSAMNVTEKGEYRAACAKLGLVFIAPDTSPRGDDVPTDPGGGSDFGLGAGFYVDSTVEPFDRNYRMWTYVTEELPDVAAEAFPLDMERQAITGHSMGGHGALTAALRKPDRFRSVSAFSPIVAPRQVPWGNKAFGGYLGEDRQAWRKYDSVALIEDGARLPEILVDVGADDPFLDQQLRPELLEQACEDSGIALTLRRQPGYDHSYYFVSTFMADHLRWHAQRLFAAAAAVAGEQQQ